MQFGKFKLRGDSYIWFAIICLSFYGLLAVYSSTVSLAFNKAGGFTESFMLKHALFLSVGFFLMYLFHLIDYTYFSRLSQLFIIIAIPLLIATLIFGNDINEAKRTITILGITFQASDFAKFALIMYVSRYLSKNQEELKSQKGFIKILVIIGVVCALILPENLSTSLVLFFTCFLLLFIGNAPIKYLFLLLLTVAVVGLLGFLFLKKAPESMLPGRAATWKARIENFSNSDEESYQTTQAKIAVATAGVFGKGAGKSEQSNYLPHPYSDFIYAVIIEEYGPILGGLVIMFLYLLILFRAIRIIIKSPKAFGALLAVGLAFAMVLQALIHMAVATSLFPVTGLTLPLVSMGGTSVIFTSAAFGVILSVSRWVEEQNQEKKEEEIA